MLISMMYHFITSPNDRSVFQGIPGVTFDEFKRQIEHLARMAEPVTHEMLVAAVQEGTSLPEKGFCITFDEGLRQQGEVVAEWLLKSHLQASYFVPTKPMSEGKVSLVEKQRVCQYSFFQSYEAFLSAFIDSLKAKLSPELVAEVELTPGNLKKAETYLAEHDFYSPLERHYRFIRNEVLSPRLFEEAIESIFSLRYPCIQKFIEDYYLTWPELGELVDRGMSLGGHTHSHPFMDKLSPSELKYEITHAANLMERFTGHRPNSYAYPYGTFSQAVIAELKNNNMLYSFGTGNQVHSHFHAKDAFNIQRVDGSSFHKVEHIL